MRKYLGIMFVVEILAVSISILFGLIFGIMSYGFIGLLIVVLISLIIIAPVVLIYAVNNLLDRVQILENKLLKKKVLTKKDLSTPKDEVLVDDVELCKVCGYQLFEEDTECPNCHTKRKQYI